MKKILFKLTTILAILFLVVNCSGANDIGNCKVAVTKNGAVEDTKEMICEVSSNLSMISAKSTTDGKTENTTSDIPTEEISLHRLSGDFKENEGPGTPTYTLSGRVELETKTWIWTSEMAVANNNQMTIKLILDATQNSVDKFNCDMIATENGATIKERMICEVSDDLSMISARNGPIPTAYVELSINRLTGELKQNDGAGTPTHTFSGSAKVKTKTWRWIGSTFVDTVTITMEDTP